MRVTVVGYLSLDQITCAAGRFDAVPGGAALYCAAAAAVCGAKVRLVARVGNDFPRDLLSALETRGVDLSGLQFDEAQSRRSRLHDPTGDARTLLHMGEAAWWEATERLAPPVPEGAGVFVFTAMPSQALAKQIASRSRDDLLIADTSVAYAKRDAAGLLGLIPSLNAFAPSREETRLLWPDLDDDAALRHMSTLVPVVLQKRGADGLALKRTGGPVMRQTSVAKAVLDTTGAGDSVVGAYAAAVAAGLSDGECLRLCADVAALTLSQVGSEGLLHEVGLGGAAEPRPTIRRA